MAPETDPRVNLTPHQKALTFQHPNERELKNEARWLYCWNLWKEILRQQIELCTSDRTERISEGMPSSSSSSTTTTAAAKNISPILFGHDQDDKSDESKEALIQELQNHIITKPVQTLSKVKTIRRIKEIRLKLDIWEKSRHEGVVFLSSLQLSICEHKTGERELDKENYKMLEIFKQKVLDKIVIMCKNIDFYMKQLEEAIDTFKNHRSCGIFIDPVVVKSIEKFNKRNSQPFVLPGLDINTMESTNSSSNPSSVAPSENTVSSSIRSKRRSSKSKRNDSQTSSSHSNFILDIPDFTETLFSGCKPPKIKSESDHQSAKLAQSSTTTQQQNSEDGCLVSSLLNPNNDSENNDIVVKEAIKRYLQILQQGTEWYFSWSQFTEKALKEIKNLAPLLGSEVLNYMTKHINKQINLLKGLVVEIRSMGQKTKRLSDSEEEMRVMTTCLSVLDDFVSLIESVKHEASYLIRYVEIALINLGVLDLNKEPLKIQPLRLYLMRNVISMKDCQLLASVDYLYKEMGFLLEFIEFRFHQKDSYLEKFGQVTADILKKYTNNRKEVIQEKEFMNIENVNKLELAREICSTDGSFGGQVGICRTPLSRYQRAEDLRKWVEESKKNLHASKSKTKSGSSSISASMPIPTSSADCENGSRSKKSSIKKEFKKETALNPMADNSVLADDPGLNMKGKDREKHVSFWKSTKSSAHNLRKEMKKKLSLKRKE